jgi:hypothetical protein
VDNIIRRGSEELRDDRKLVDMVLSWEKRLALQHLREDTTRTPDINLHIILLPCKHDLRRPVVSRRDISGHLGILQTGEAEVADLEIAVLVYEDVARLEIAMDDTCGVDIFETPLKEWVSTSDPPKGGVGNIYQDLVKKVLDELLLEGS